MEKSRATGFSAATRPGVLTVTSKGGIGASGEEKLKLTTCAETIGPRPCSHALKLWASVSPATETVPDAVASGFPSGELAALLLLLLLLLLS